MYEQIVSPCHGCWVFILALDLQQKIYTATFNSTVTMCTILIHHTI